MTNMGAMLVEDGKKEKAIEIAKNMIIKKIDIETIIEVTGLLRNEVEVLEIVLQQDKK